MRVRINYHKFYVTPVFLGIFWNTSLIRITFYELTSCPLK